METAGVMVEFAPVTAENWEPFAGLTYPEYGRLAPEANGTGGTLAVGAMAFGEPVGLILARREADGGLAVLSVYVAAAWRRQGVATRLLAELEAAARQAGAGRLSCVYTTPHAGAEAWLRILRRAGWSSPKPRMLLAESSLEAFWSAPWLHRYVLPADFEAFPWEELTAAERAGIAAREGEPGWYGPELSPFAGEAPERDSSLGLRHQGQVMGWVLVHRALPGFIRYDNIFVNAACEPRAVALPLLAAAIRRHAAGPLRAISHGFFNVACDNVPMVRFLQRRLLPQVTSLRQSWGTEKLLPAPVAVCA